MKRRPIELDIAPDGILRPVTALAKNHGSRANARAVVLAGVLVACGAWLGGGCAPAGAKDDAYFGDTTPPRGQVFTFNNGAEPEHLDPAVMSGQPDGRIARLVFEGLCTADPKTLEPRPGQAARWDLSDDRLTYTFHLRPGLTWADGTPLTAQDFLWSWRRVLSPATGSRYASFLYAVKNAEAFNKRELADSTQVGLAAPDDSTFVVTLAQPTPYFLELATFYTTLPTPRHVIEKLGDGWEHALRLVGNGPFRIVEWKSKDRFVLAPNERYWNRPVVKLEKIIALPIEELSTATNLYKAGAVDWNPSGYVPKQVIPFVQDKKDFAGGPYHAIYFYSIVVTRKPFNDPWVRRALNAATDRESIARYVLKNTVPAWGNMTPMGYEGYTTPPGLKYDPAYARECLAKAGYPGGKGFPKIEILFNTSEDHRRIAEAIQAMWKRDLGIPVALSNQEWASYLAATNAKEYDVARRSWIGDFRDPMTFLDMWVSGSGNNRTNWSDARYDALIRQATTETDPARRLALLSEAESILLADGPVIPIYHYTQSALVKPYVRGIHSTLLDVHPLTEVRIDHGGAGVTARDDAPALAGRGRR
ncbi:MAG: peptide ABC transporter substrate-binding protein [Candidatus Eisenbacteria bacterium]